jgi:diguanylate cyclase (GGDEF)-like protein
MGETSGNERSLTSAAGVLPALVLGVVCLLTTVSAFAACLTSPDPEVRRLQSLVSQDAAKAVTAVQARIDALKNSSPERTAAFYSVLAQAFQTLELDRDARKAASTGLALVPRVDDPVHLDLLMSLSENIYDSAGLATAMADIEAAQRVVERGSVADTCLAITFGRLQHRQDRDDLAVLTLTRAYRSSMSPGMAEQRMLAAAALANVVADLGDLPQSLTLNQEVIDWYTAHDAWLGLSVTRYLRGEIYRRMRDYAAAVKEYTEARRLSMLLADHQGVAFADLRMCQAQIELSQWIPARQQCKNALRIFTASQSTDVLKEAQALLAQIDLNEGHASQALVALNSVLDQNGADMPPRRVANLYRLRAQTNAALKQYQNAYADLDEYVRRYVQVNDTERTQQSAALRARFETDREIERNESLQRELVLGQERWQRQKDLLRWTIIGVVAGGFAIVLLTYILIISLRHRRQLTRLAGRDSLTGVANRRRIVELATQALNDAASQQQPLTVGLIDLDHFKIINDRCGHAVGDHVLQEFARLARESLRASDLFGRWGGEEFLVVLPNTTLDTALSIMERLRLSALAIQLPSSGEGLRVSISAGLATNEHGASTLDSIVAAADAALYDAKDRGRDAVRIANESYRMASTGVRRALRSSGAVVATGQFPQASGRRTD